VPIGARRATGQHRPPCTSSAADTADPHDPPHCARPPPVPAGPGCTRRDKTSSRPRRRDLADRDSVTRAVPGRQRPAVYRRRQGSAANN